MSDPVTARRTQRERSEATTAAIVDAARRLFATKGYADTQIDDIAREAGVTKGAVYHHFADKRDLFRAVFEEEQERLAVPVMEAYAGASDPWKGFALGYRAFLELAVEPGLQRIALQDAIAVLGWDAVREIEYRTSMRMIVNGLEEAMRAGKIARRPVQPLAHVLFGALCEGAMMVARADDPKRVTRDLLATMDDMLGALHKK